MIKTESNAKFERLPEILNIYFALFFMNSPKIFNVSAVFCLFIGLAPLSNRQE